MAEPALEMFRKGRVGEFEGVGEGAFLKGGCGEGAASRAGEEGLEDLAVGLEAGGQEVVAVAGGVVGFGGVGGVVGGGVGVGAVGGGVETEKGARNARGALSHLLLLLLLLLLKLLLLLLFLWS